ncbi:glutathione S-transferase 1 [Anabrus simplex]|uniref:glutathione S-transferase 1 n=1 Tax=Anabrus simplex TaxID=316456 RepID=UPI0035A2BB58
MPITLYHLEASPPSRTALLSAKLVGVDVNVKIVDLFTGKHLEPEFLKMNPLHTVPVLDDDGFIVSDSQAIACYLTNKYSKDDKLYPKDPKKRAVVDQRLYFAATVLFPRLRNITYPVFFEGATSVSEDKKAQVLEALKILDGYLAPTGWVAGDNLTIADIACLTNVSTYPGMGFDLAPYKNVSAWLDRCRKQVPSYQEVNQVGVDILRKGFESCLHRGEKGDPKK